MHAERERNSSSLRMHWSVVEIYVSGIDRKCADRKSICRFISNCNGIVCEEIGRDTMLCELEIIEAMNKMKILIITITRNVRDKVQLRENRNTRWRRVGNSVTSSNYKLNQLGRLMYGLWW